MIIDYFILAALTDLPFLMQGSIKHNQALLNSKSVVSTAKPNPAKSKQKQRQRVVAVEWKKIPVKERAEAEADGGASASTRDGGDARGNAGTRVKKGLAVPAPPEVSCGMGEEGWVGVP